MPRTKSTSTTSEQRKLAKQRNLGNPPLSKLEFIKQNELKTKRQEENEREERDFINYWEKKKPQERFSEELKEEKKEKNVKRKDERDKKKLESSSRQLKKKTEKAEKRKEKRHEKKARHEQHIKKELARLIDVDNGLIYID